MTIKRNINGTDVEITLTAAEISEAHTEFILNFYISELNDNFDFIPEEDRKDVAQNAYDIYSEGDGQTEYDALEEAVESYKEDNSFQVTCIEWCDVPNEIILPVEIDLPNDIDIEDLDAIFDYLSSVTGFSARRCVLESIAG